MYCTLQFNLALVKEKITHDTWERIGRQTFRGGHCERNWDHHSKVLYLGGKIGLNSKYIKGKWEFIAKDQGRNQWM